MRPPHVRYMYENDPVCREPCGRGCVSPRGRHHYARPRTVVLCVFKKGLGFLAQRDTDMHRQTSFHMQKAVFYAGLRCFMSAKPTRVH